MHFSLFVITALAVPSLSASVPGPAQIARDDLDVISSKVTAFNNFMKQAPNSNMNDMNKYMQDTSNNMNQLSHAFQKASYDMKVANQHGNMPNEVVPVTQGGGEPAGRRRQIYVKPEIAVDHVEVVPVRSQGGGEPAGRRRQIYVKPEIGNESHPGALGSNCVPGAPSWSECAATKGMYYNPGENDNFISFLDNVSNNFISSFSAHFWRPGCPGILCVEPRQIQMNHSLENLMRDVVEFFDLCARQVMDNDKSQILHMKENVVNSIMNVRTVLGRGLQAA